jgi:hypothetical protein
MREDFLHRLNHRLLGRLVDRLGGGVPLVAIVEESDPPTGISEDTPHAGDRLSVL